MLKEKEVLKEDSKNTCVVENMERTVHGSAHQLGKVRFQVQAIKIYDEARIEAGIMQAGLPLRKVVGAVVNEEVLAPPPHPSTRARACPSQYLTVHVRGRQCMLKKPFVCVRVYLWIRLRAFNSSYSRLNWVFVT